MKYFFELLALISLVMVVLLFIVIISNHQNFVPIIGTVGLSTGFVLVIVHIVKSNKVIRN